MVAWRPDGTNQAFLWMGEIDMKGPQVFCARRHRDRSKLAAGSDGRWSGF
jgi:hypothetical protein